MSAPASAKPKKQGMRGRFSDMIRGKFFAKKYFSAVKELADREKTHWALITFSFTDNNRKWYLTR